MSSIIGQAMQSAGPSLGAIGSSIGSGISSIFGSGAPTPPTDTAFSAGGLSSSGDPGYVSPAATSSAFGTPAPTPADVMSPSGIAGAPYSPVTPNTPESIMNPGNVGGTATAPYSPTAADPSAPDATLWQEIQNFFGGGAAGTGAATGAGGAAAKGGLGLGGWLGLGGNLMEMLNRYLVQRTLQNPAALTSAASKLAIPMGAQARNRILGPVEAQAMESSGVNAPLLYSQAMASALAPFQYQNEQRALQEEIAALTASEGGAFAGPNLFGGSGSGATG